MKHFPKLITLAVGISSSFIATAGQWEGPLNGIVSSVVNQGYENYATSAKVLEQSSQTLCLAPSSNTLETARADFKQNALDWQELQWLNFGPVTYFMRYYAFQYWPDKKGVTQRQLRALTQGDPAIMDEPKFWTSASIAVRGLTAIESLLYHPDFDPVNNANHCNLLERVAAHHVESAADVSEQWKNGQAQDFVYEEEGTEFDPEKIALESFLQQWLEHMSAVKDSKLETPIGYNGHENLKLAEFYRSGLSLTAMQKNLQSYRVIYHSGSPSLYDMAKKQNLGVADQLEQQLIHNVKLSLQLPENFFAPGLSQADRIEMATPLVKSISASQSYLTTLVTQMGFQIGFNSRDGD